MESKNKKISYSIVTLILYGIASYLILFCQIPRQIGLTFRNTLYVFPIIFGIAYLYCRIQNKFINIFLKCCLFSVVLLPYSGMINSGLSDQYALGGFVPWSDAFTMQLNTQRFLYGGIMGQSTAIRPLSTVFYAVFLYFTSNNYFALQIFLCICTAICMISTLHAVNQGFGSISGAFFFTILHFYIRKRIGTFMTEQYGFICGLLCCYFFFTGIRTKKQLPMLFGFLFLSIGLNARPAAMFLFPFIGLWYFFVFLKHNSKRYIYAAIALLLMLSGFAINRISQIMVYGPDKIPNRQAAEMIYGLCLGGKSWGDVVSSDEMIALNNSENVIKDVASLCGPVLKEHPENIIAALRTIFIDSLIKSEYYGAFSFVNGNPKNLNTIVRYLLMALWLLGIITCFKYKSNHLQSFLLVCAAGIILSECAAVPFSSNYLRLYAVSMWVPACITGLFPQMIAARIMKRDSHQYTILFCSSTENALLYAICLCICITAVFGAYFIKSHPLERPTLLSDKCSADEDILITSVDEGSFIYLAEKPDLKIEHYPYFRLPYVRQHFHDTASVEMFEFTDAIEEPTAIIRGLDMQNYEDALIFAPLEMVESKTGFVQFCGRFIDPPILRNDRFFIPNSAYFYEDEL